MRPTALQVRKALEGRLAALRVRIPAKVLRIGDLVEYLATYGAWRTGRVLRVQPRANRIVVGPPTRNDLPRGYKDLADALRAHVTRVEMPDGKTVDRVVHREPRGTLVFAQQIIGVFQGEPGSGRTVVRPGTDAWIQFIEARAAEDRTDKRTEGAEGPSESENPSVATGAKYPAPSEMRSPAAPPNPVAAFQADLLAAFEDRRARP